MKSEFVWSSVFICRLDLRNQKSDAESCRQAGISSHQEMAFGVAACDMFWFPVSI